MKLMASHSICRNRRAPKFSLRAVEFRSPSARMRAASSALQLFSSETKCTGTRTGSNSSKDGLGGSNRQIISEIRPFSADFRLYYDCLHASFNMPKRHQNRPTVRSQTLDRL